MYGSKRYRGHFVRLSLADLPLLLMHEWCMLDVRHTQLTKLANSKA
jgi:hypothetical protein